MLRIENLSKTYGNNKKKAVDNLSLEVKSGEIYGFIGHNGAGKTTTIKSIVGIIEFEEGNVYIDGISLKEDSIACKRLLAYIPDNPDIYDSLTGIQYLNFIGDMFEIPIKERQELIDKYSEIFKLKDNLVDIISSYSHGMKQKLVIISALIHKPRLLVLDEPFVGLDPKAAFTLKSIMKDMCKEGTSVFFSSHVLEVVEKLCDRVGIIKEGKLVLEGKTSKIIGDKSLESLFLELNNE